MQEAAAPSLQDLHWYQWLHDLPTSPCARFTLSWNRFIFFIFLFFCMDDNSLPYIYGFLTPQVIWLKHGIGEKVKTVKRHSKWFPAVFRSVEAALESAMGMGPCVSREGPGAVGRSSSWRRKSPCPRGFLSFSFLLSFFLWHCHYYYFSHRGWGAVGFTRRNDASQPRLHPAPPQRNRLFGKKRVGVCEKSHWALYVSCSRITSCYLTHQNVP